MKKIFLQIEKRVHPNNIEERIVIFNRIYIMLINIYYLLILGLFQGFHVSIKHLHRRRITIDLKRIKSIC